MLLNLTQLALAECSIQVKYNGNKSFATIVIDADGGAESSPLVKLGVSDVSLAQAVTNAVTVFTGASTSTLDDLIVAIKNGSGGTVGADTEIGLGDFDARALDCYQEKSIYHASVNEFVDEAGTGQNLRGYNDGNGSAWFSTLVRDNDANAVGCVMKRIGSPDWTKGPIAIAEINGITTQSDGSTQVTSGIVREILDCITGAVLWSCSMATPTAAGLKFYYESGPVVFPRPVIVRDRVLTANNSNEGDVDKTTTAVLWGVPGQYR